MSDFDQRGQKVTNQTNVSGNQYNAGGDIKHVEGDVVGGNKIHVEGDVVKGTKIEGDVTLGDKIDLSELLRELASILDRLGEAERSGELDAETALDVEHPLKKAKLEVVKEPPDKTKLLGYVDTAKKVLDKAAGASKSAATLGTAVGSLGS